MIQAVLGSHGPVRYAYVSDDLKGVSDVKQRFWLYSTVLVILFAGCSAPATPTQIAATDVASGPSALSVAVASNDFGVGSPRVPFVLFQGTQPITNAQSIAMVAFDLAAGTPTKGWQGSAIGYNDYNVPYWVVFPQLSHAGYWGLGAVVTLADGTQSQAQFTVQALDTPAAPKIGDTPPASHNRTLMTEPDIAKLTSDTNPEPGLYQLTVADALKSGKPTVVTFATPAYCTSRLCAPVVNSIKTVYNDLKAKVNFIHIEVYKSFNPLVYADEMAEWRLQGEPWTFVIGADGKIVATLGGPMSPRELEQALQPLLAQ
jgi:hypothetical protein